jgi:hypothetical protein
VALSHPEDLLVTIPDDDRILTSLNSANDLLHAGLNGRISRRGLIARARDLGLTAGVTAVLLNATGLPARAAETLVTDRKKTKPARSIRSIRIPPTSTHRDSTSSRA